MNTKLLDLTFQTPNTILAMSLCIGRTVRQDEAYHAGFDLRLYTWTHLHWYYSSNISLWCSSSTCWLQETSLLCEYRNASSLQCNASFLQQGHKMSNPSFTKTRHIRPVSTWDCTREHVYIVLQIFLCDSAQVHVDSKKSRFFVNCNASSLQCNTPSRQQGCKMSNPSSQIHNQDW
jgi:hypothetical protein